MRKLLLKLRMKPCFAIEKFEGMDRRRSGIFVFSNRLQIPPQTEKRTYEEADLLRGKILRTAEKWLKSRPGELEEAQLFIEASLRARRISRLSGFLNSVIVILILLISISLARIVWDIIPQNKVQQENIKEQQEKYNDLKNRSRKEIDEINIKRDDERRIYNDSINSAKKK